MVEVKYIAGDGKVTNVEIADGVSLSFTSEAIVVSAAPATGKKTGKYVGVFSMANVIGARVTD